MGDGTTGTLSQPVLKAAAMLRRQAHLSAQTVRLIQGKMAENSRCKNEAPSRFDDKAQRGILQMRTSLEVEYSICVSICPCQLLGEEEVLLMSTLAVNGKVRWALKNGKDKLLDPQRLGVKLNFFKNDF